MNGLVSELVKTVGGIIRSAFPQLQNMALDQSNPAVDQAPTDAALRGSLLGLASGVKAVTEEDATGKSPVEKRPLALRLAYQPISSVESSPLLSSGKYGLRHEKPNSEAWPHDGFGGR
jgi:hypothetical protein